MSQTIGEYLYRIAWSLDKSGTASLKKEGDAAQKSVDGLGKSLDKTEREAQDLTRAADKTAPAVREVGRASDDARRETERLDSTAQQVTSTLKRLVAGVASFAAARRAFSAIISTATEMDALANSAAAVGASAAGMARLAYATDLAGVNASEMDSALKGVRQSAAQAAAGIGAGVKAWRLIGISTRDENGNLKDTTRLIDELGVKFAAMDEGRAQALGKLLKMTPAVIGALRSGMMDYAREFDQALGSMTPTFDEAVKAAQRLHSAQSRLQRIAVLLWQGIATRFFEPFEKAFDSLRRTIVINQEALVRFGAAVLQPLALLLSGFAEAVGVVSNALTVLTGVFDALGPVSQTVLQTLLWGMAAYALALHKITLAQIAAAATNPFVLIGAAIVAVMLLLDDFATAMRGGKTYFDWTPAIKIFKSLGEWGAKIEEWIKALPDKITGALADIWATLKSWWTTAIDWMAAKWHTFVETVTGWMPDALKKQLGIKVEGEAPAAPEFKPAATAAPVAQVLDTAPERRQLIRELGGETPATPQQPAPIQEQGRGMAAFRAATERAAIAAPAAQSVAPTPTPTPQRFAAALVGSTAQSSLSPGVQPSLAAGATLTSISNAVTNVTNGARLLSSAQPLGTTTVTNNNDNSRKYDIPVTVTNSTTVNVTTTNTDAGSIADQVGAAVDSSNAKLVRDMQSPLAAIADDDAGGMTTE